MLTFKSNNYKGDILFFAVENGAVVKELELSNSGLDVFFTLNRLSLSSEDPGNNIYAKIIDLLLFVLIFVKDNLLEPDGKVKKIPVLDWLFKKVYRSFLLELATRIIQIF